MAEGREFVAAMQVIGRLRAAGYEAYLAGGCVRDMLLGREPDDFDVATSATPDVVLGMFERTFAVGAKFGVVLVATTCGTCVAADAADAATCGGADAADAATCGGADAAGAAEEDLSERDYVVTEVATFRSDGAYSDGRRPDVVRYAESAEEDVQRRDFTINGLLLDALRAADLWSNAEALRSAVIDHVGGLKDIEAGVVRAIGEPTLRFEEDQLRLLRAVRFAARFGFEIETETKAAMRACAAKIATVSRERVRDELTKMLTEGKARRAFELLDETGLLVQVLPEIAAMKGVEQPPQFHPEGDVWVHTLMLLEQLEAGCPATLGWGALLHDVGKPPTFTRTDRVRFNGHVEMGVAMGAEICRRFRFSNDETRMVLALIENHMRFADVHRMKASTLKRFFRLEAFEQHLALHRMDCLAASGNLENWEFAREALASMGEEAVRPKPLLTGRELIAAGYAPGAGFKEMLRMAEDAQLDGTVTTQEEALALVRARFPQA
jgi:poly(A) polymerase